MSKENYKVELSEDGVYTVNGVEFDSPYLNFKELTEEKACTDDFVNKILNTADPDGKIPDELKPVFSSIILTLVYQLWNVEDSLVQLDKDLYNHEHTTKTVPVVKTK